jgi:hypothetical protein
MSVSVAAEILCWAMAFRNVVVLIGPLLRGSALRRLHIAQKNSPARTTQLPAARSNRFNKRRAYFAA